MNTIKNVFIGPVQAVEDYLIILKSATFLYRNLRTARLKNQEKKVPRRFCIIFPPPALLANVEKDY